MSIAPPHTTSGRQRDERMTGHATITLVRQAAHPNRIRAYRVFVDDREVATVKNGSTTTVDISAGKHQLFVKVDWVRSAPLELVVQPGDNVHVDCLTSPDPMQILLASFGRPSTHISLHRRDEPGRLSDTAAQLMSQPGVSPVALVSPLLGILMGISRRRKGIRKRRSTAIGQASVGQTGWSGRLTRERVCPACGGARGGVALCAACGALLNPYWWSLLGIGAAIFLAMPWIYMWWVGSVFL